MAGNSTNRPRVQSGRPKPQGVVSGNGPQVHRTGGSGGVVSGGGPQVHSTGLPEQPLGTTRNLSILYNTRYGTPWLPTRVLPAGIDLTGLQTEITSLRNRVLPKPVNTGKPVSTTTAIPKNVYNVSAAQSPIAVQNKTVSDITVTFSRNPSDSAFDHVNIWVKGYHGNTNPVLYASSSDSPANFTLESSGETVTVYVQAASASGVTSAFVTNCPSYTVKLSGVVTNPPAPTISQNLIGTPLGYQFSFAQVQLPAGSEDVIKSYQVWRNTSANSFSSASLLQTIPDDGTNSGSAIVVQDRVGGGHTYYYFVTSTNTKGLRSASSSAQSGSVTSGTASLDNDVSDGSSFARVTTNALTSNKIDFGKTGFQNKNLDNVGDGSTYLRVLGVNASHLLGSEGTAQVYTQAVSQSTSSILTQSGTSKTINVAAFTLQYGFGTVSYNSGSVTPGSYGAFVIYFSDPNYAGGAVTYNATNQTYQSVAQDGYQAIGVITTSVGGGGSGGGGGGNAGNTCFSPDTKVKTKRGDIPFGELQPGDEILTARGNWKPIFAISRREYSGPMQQMEEGLVTPGHLILDSSVWIHAKEIWEKVVEYTGVIMNIFLRCDRDDDWRSPRTEHSYTLANGRVAHNFLTG